MAVKVNTPASSANLGPGFDVLGLALGLHNAIQVDFGESLSLKVEGEGEGILDRKPRNNLAYRAIEHFYDHIKVDIPALAIHMDNKIPLARGLGSSAATIVGALSAVNTLSSAGLTMEDIFHLAVDIEGHADNVAAALYGGLIITYKESSDQKIKKVSPASNIGVVVLVPEKGLSTAKARAALPGSVERKDAVFNVGRVALLVEALISGDLDRLSSATEDALHQPWRRNLIDDYDRTVEVFKEAGAKGSALSGAGPTVIAFYDKAKHTEFNSRLTSVVEGRRLRRKPFFLEIDGTGTQIIENGK